MALVNDSPLGNAELHHPITETVRNALTATSTPGATIALLLDGQPVFLSAVGFRDLEQTTALNAHAQFYIYSVTKTLIATVILQLVEQGCIALDTPIQRVLPQVPLYTHVTIRQLLNHTGGIPDYGALPAYFEALQADPAHPWSSDEFLNATLPTGLRFAPGQGWGYSNIGFLLLRNVIEAVLQTSFRTALHDRIFAPLELQHTFVARTRQDALQLTPGYSAFFASDDTVHDIRWLYHPEWVSHGVVISTAWELACMTDALFTGQLISPRSRAAMLEAVDVPIRHPLFGQPAYGLGVMIDRRSRYGIVAGHGGGGPGYSAAALHVPDVHGHRITSIALANRDQDDLGLQIAFAIAMMVGDTVAP